jgi:nucleotide-binding universal stress UspA family protein
MTTDDAGRHDFELGTDGPKVILAGVDGTEPSLRAAAYAAGLARRQNALLALVYVRPAALALEGAVIDTGAGVAEELEQLIRASARVYQQTYPRLRWEFHVRHGEPFHELAAAADQVRADAMVVGASERLGHRLIGSLAVRLVRAGRWPVTVVP